jgi:hypothetical protein
MKKDAKDTPRREGRKPFFARLLEAQELEQVAGGITLLTRKFPSDNEEHDVTKKAPSDSDEVAVTLKYPSDSEDSGGGCAY